MHFVLRLLNCRRLVPKSPSGIALSGSLIFCSGSGGVLDLLALNTRGKANAKDQIAKLDCIWKPA